MKAKPANILLEKHLRELGLRFHAEHQFAKPRKWRFDYVLEDEFSPWIAIEIEGGIYTQGRHTRGKGYEADLEKYNVAQANGWTVYRFSTGMVLRGEAKAFLAEWLGREGGR